MRTGKPCSSQSLSVRENIGWHRSPFYCVAVVLRSTFQRSRGIIEKGWHLFSWNAAVPSCLGHPFPSVTLTHCVRSHTRSLRSLNVSLHYVPVLRTCTNTPCSTTNIH